MKRADVSLAIVALCALQAMAAPPTIYDPGHLGGYGSAGTAINNAGQVAGWNHTAGNAATHAFLYTGTPGVDGQMIDLDAWLDANNPTAKSEAVRRSDGYN